MKRSEMLKVMMEAHNTFVDKIKEACPTYPMNKLTIADCGFMLEAMVDAGMLPPGQRRHLVTVKLLDGEKFYNLYEKHEWEAEDETK